jgi:hypothetical protein
MRVRHAARCCIHRIDSHQAAELESTQPTRYPTGGVKPNFSFLYVENGTN